MTVRTRLFALLMTLLVINSVTGCQRTYDYSFAQSIENIEKVEICEYDYYSHSTTLIAVLDTEDAESLLSEIDALACKRHFGDHTSTYGEVVVYITYTDGTGEVIGLRNVAQVDEDGQWHIGIEYFDAAEICALIMKYVDVNSLPDLSKYFD